MSQRKSACRFGQACPAGLLIAKSAEDEKAGATQHSAKQLWQSALRPGRSPAAEGSSCSRISDNVCGLHLIQGSRATKGPLISMRISFLTPSGTWVESCHDNARMMARHVRGVWTQGSDHDN